MNCEDSTSDFYATFYEILNLPDTKHYKIIQIHSEVEL